MGRFVLRHISANGIVVRKTTTIFGTNCSAVIGTYKADL